MSRGWHEENVGVVTVNAAGSGEIDLGTTSWSQHYVVRAVHADGTPAPVRSRHSASALPADPALITDRLICENGNGYEFQNFRTLSVLMRYLKVYGLSDGTLVSVSRRMPGE